MKINIREEKGMTLKKIIIIVAVIIVGLYILGLGNNSSKTTNSPGKSTASFTKEDRSTYTQKCTKIDYSTLARNPNIYKGKDYTFTGEVIQTMEDGKGVTLRVNVTPKKYEYSQQTYYEDTILVYYEYSSNYESKILENDIITIYGKSGGSYTYESVMGSAITVPMINAMYIDIQNK